MESLFTNYEIRQQSKANSNRASIIEMFVTEINRERFKTKYGKIAPRVVAIKVGHIKGDDLYAFHRQCMDYKNVKGSYSKCFFGALKVR